MFGKFTRDNKYAKRDYVIRGVINSRPAEITVQAFNAMDAVDIAKASNPGMIVHSIQVAKQG